jgi:hypothetical protein
MITISPHKKWKPIWITIARGVTSLIMIAMTIINTSLNLGNIRRQSNPS